MNDEKLRVDVLTEAGTDTFTPPRDTPLIDRVTSERADSEVPEGGMDASVTPTDNGPLPDLSIVPSDVVNVDTVRAISPLSGAQLRTRRPSLRWAAFMGITRYRVEFSATRAFSAVESSFTVDSLSGSPAMDLPQGLRFWRVVPAPLGAMEGVPSAPWGLHLGRARNDLNGDGFSDVALAAPGSSASASRAGRVYVHHGGAMMDTTTDLSLTGEAANDYFGSALSLRGDLNGDGFADLAVGAPFNASGGIDAGRVYVFLGGPRMSASPSVTLTGAAVGARFGTSVAIVGDLNGDGFADLAVGAPGVTGSGPLSGRVYVYYGSSSFDTTADLTVSFAAAGDQLGRAVAGASDVNGDGFEDLLVGAPRNDARGMTDAGQGYVLFGGAPMDSDIDVTFAGTMMDELSASSLAGLGDYNGDGYGDVIVGAPNHRAGGTMAGAGFVYYGARAPDGRADVTLRGSGLESFGRSIAGAGDVNHDGFADILVGAPFNPAMGMNTGQAYLFLGAQTPTASPAVTYSNAIGNDELGSAVSGAGDTNGDDFDDLLLGAHLAPFSGRGGPGSAYLYHGASTPNPMPRLSFRGVAGDNLGAALATIFRFSTHTGG